jgi:hypothetical protein
MFRFNLTLNKYNSYYYYTRPMPVPSTAVRPGNREFGRSLGISIHRRIASFFFKIVIAACRHGGSQAAVGDREH